MATAVSLGWTIVLWDDELESAPAAGMRSPTRRRTGSSARPLPRAELNRCVGDSATDAGMFSEHPSVMSRVVRGRITTNLCRGIVSITQF
jgi:hypothetical protein